METKEYFEKVMQDLTRTIEVETCVSIRCQNIHQHSQSMGYADEFTS